MSDFAFIFIGSVLHAVTFTAGILIGASLRKDARHDNDSNEGTTKDQKWWHDPVGTGTESGAGRSSGSSAGKERTSRATERPLVVRGTHWE